MIAFRRFLSDMRLCISIVLAGCLSAFNWGTTDEEKGLCIGSIEPSCYNKVQRYGICCIDRDNKKEYRNSCFACNDVPLM